ncbi:ferredoxin reductase [Nitrospira moscoviensis]|uniref:Oxidoreductase FAD/NAD(P)-binding domain protein n=1 Tax=Nitrospira moscoviensis TaxID=42253 RepID=A0A0K2GAH1_NITMO|nr:ferredoxin reductase [Nitrospira moscoviensis]ALA57961.1 Oxidoreductase FAD/NAD(P)-binding domain protein [Nitrospira moscoviensis]
MIRPPKPTAWQAAKVLSIREETPRVKTIRFAVSHWPGHLAGQHADVRVMDKDGCRAERSYSIASPPGTPGLELTVERLEEGEVSQFLTGRLQPDDTIELRGPIGGYFVWSALQARNPLLLLAGGSGVVPLMCMLRHRRLLGSPVPATLLYSCRTREDVIYEKELSGMVHSDPRFELRITLTRDVAPGWSGAVGRLDLSLVRTYLERLGGAADSFVCGYTGFVEAASTMLLQAGQPGEAIRTERFGSAGPFSH